MPIKHVIPCGWTTAGSVEPEAKVLPLNLWTDSPHSNKVTLKIEDIHRRLFKPVPKQFEDLLEIAAYVYCADQATSRGGMDVDAFGDHWRRHFQFTIPVRVPELWNQPAVKSLLTQTLEFLADDYFEFEFVAAGKDAPGMNLYLPAMSDDGPEAEVDGVVMFSGGLDSLAGALVETVKEKQHVMLVTHKPTNKLNNVHKRLNGLLAEKLGKYRPTHLHVRVHKDSDLNKNYTQRTRSFLYAAVGATVARMQGLDLLKFYENGVVSMNLPVCAQVVGSRATRTTHPRVLVDFGRLFSAVGEREFRVANDFIWQTKGEVIKTIVELGGENLIGASLSCAHVYGYSKEFPHCGTCSQCIDRRVAMVAVEKEDFDPAGGYKSDVFTGKRPEDEDRMMVATYVERANRLAKLGNVAELISQYPEVTRVLAHLPGKPGAMAEKVLDLHRRHAGEVNRAVEKMIAKHAPALRQHTLPMDCLLRLTYDSGGGVAPASPLPAPAVKVCHQKQEARWKQEEEGPNVYRLGKGYKAWHLVFQGKPEVLADERAVHLVEYLLKQRPEDGIHASVLETRVDGNPVADGFAGVEIDGRSEEVELSVGGPIQEGAGKKLMGGESVLLTRKVAELSEAIADETMPEYEREQARVELSELFSAKGRGGKMVGGAEKAADRVRKAIRSLIDELKAAEVTKGKANLVLRAFGEHLERYLWLPSRGGPGRIGASCRPGCYTYEAPPGVTWRD